MYVYIDHVSFVDQSASSGNPSRPADLYIIFVIPPAISEGMERGRHMRPRQINSCVRVSLPEKRVVFFFSILNFFFN